MTADIELDILERCFMAAVPPVDEPRSPMGATDDPRGRMRAPPNATRLVRTSLEVGPFGV